MMDSKPKNSSLPHLEENDATVVRPRSAFDDAFDAHTVVKLEAKTLPEESPHLPPPPPSAHYQVKQIVPPPPQATPVNRMEAEVEAQERTRSPLAHQVLLRTAAGISLAAVAGWVILSHLSETPHAEKKTSIEQASQAAPQKDEGPNPQVDPNLYPASTASATQTLGAVLSSFDDAFSRTQARSRPDSRE